jgi:hypothetical protein
MNHVLHVDLLVIVVPHPVQKYIFLLLHFHYRFEIFIFVLIQSNGCQPHTASFVSVSVDHIVETKMLLFRVFLALLINSHCFDLESDMIWTLIIIRWRRYIVT